VPTSTTATSKVKGVLVFELAFRLRIGGGECLNETAPLQRGSIWLWFGCSFAAGLADALPAALADSSPAGFADALAGALVAVLAGALLLIWPVPCSEV